MNVSAKEPRLMDTQKQERLKACLQEVAQILYDESDSKAIEDLEGIEKTVRAHLLEHVGPQIGPFLSTKLPKPAGGSARSEKLYRHLGNSSPASSTLRAIGLSTVEPCIEQGLPETVCQRVLPACRSRSASADRDVSGTQ